MTAATQTVLVTGATGKVGRHVVRGLLARGVNVRALVRRPAVAGLPEGAEIVQGDLGDPDTVAAAAVGADAAFLLWPSYSAEGAAEVVTALSEHVPHLVHLSAGLLQRGRQGPMPGVWADIERLVEESGVTWTFVRAGGFAANTLGWAAGIREHGVVRLTFPGAARSLVHEQDIAEVSVHALLEPEHRGHAYDVTGPDVLTQTDQVKHIANAARREIRIEEQTPESAVAEADPSVRDMVQASLTHWATLVDDPELTRDDVERVTGHPPRTFEQWARDHVLDFAALSTAEVARHYADGFRQGDIARATAMLAPDIVRIAPLETDGEPVEVRGLESIMANAEQQNADVDIDGVEVSEPFVGDDRFAIRFDFAERHRPTGRRQTTTKISLCTVRASRIVREEVFYHSSPHA